MHLAAVYAQNTVQCIPYVVSLTDNTKLGWIEIKKILCRPRNEEGMVSAPHLDYVIGAAYRYSYVN